MKQNASDMKERRPLKVLVLSHSSELSGGAERSMLDLFDNWTANGYVKPHFILRKPLVGLEKEMQKRGWPYTSIHYTNWAQRNPTKSLDSIFMNTKANGLAVREIEKLIDRISPDIVMTNTIISPWAALAAHYKKIPHVWFVREFGTDHGHVFEIGRDKTFHDIGALSKMVITNSKTVAENIAEFIPRKKLAVLYNPFKLEAIESRSQEPIANPFKHEGSLKLVITGRISDSKGQKMAAEAVGRLTRKGHSVELCVVGDKALDGDDASLLATIEKYGICDRVHLVGHQPNPLPYVASADVGIMASRAEAFGRVTFEYMVLGKPVVGSLSGATPELIKPGYSGALYKVGSAQELAHEIEAYLKDPALIAQHGTNARKHARAMMSGSRSAEAVYREIRRQYDLWKLSPMEVINFSRRWLDYPFVAQDFIDEYGHLSLKKILYRKVRARLKYIYIGLNGRLGKLKK